MEFTNYYFVISVTSVPLCEILLRASFLCVSVPLCLCERFLVLSLFFPLCLLCAFVRGFWYCLFSFLCVSSVPL